VPLLFFSPLIVAEYVVNYNRESPNGMWPFHAECSKFCHFTIQKEKTFYVDVCPFTKLQRDIACIHNIDLFSWRSFPFARRYLSLRYVLIKFRRVVRIARATRRRRSPFVRNNYWPINYFVIPSYPVTPSAFARACATHALEDESAHRIVRSQLSHGRFIRREGVDGSRSLLNTRVWKLI